MKAKVTSYEISKRLSELGFDSESHTGWWLPPLVTDAYKQSRPLWANRQYEFMDYKDASGNVNKAVKAYDTWDLLMWLQDNKPTQNLYIGLEEFSFMMCKRADQPQNALGLAVIKLLEEKE